MMNVFKEGWTSERCLIQHAHASDMHSVASIFADNEDAVRTQGPDCQYEELASMLLRHKNLPPDGNASQASTFLIVEKTSNSEIGLLDVYCGYPTNRTLYIGSLFFRRDWQRRGLGKEIIERLEHHAVQDGYNEARVLVGLKNWPALRFWHALGFSRITGFSGDPNHTDTAYANVELIKTLTSPA